MARGRGVDLGVVAAEDLDGVLVAELRLVWPETFFFFHEYKRFSTALAVHSGCVLV